METEYSKARRELSVKTLAVKFHLRTCGRRRRKPTPTVVLCPLPKHHSVSMPAPINVQENFFKVFQNKKFKYSNFLRKMLYRHVTMVT